MSLALGHLRLGVGDKSLSEQSVAILRRFGSDAHVYMPGVGAISGLQSNNYTASDGSTGFSSIDGPQGLVLDAMGSLGSELVDQTLFSAGDAGALVTANASTVTVLNNDPTAAYTNSLGTIVIGNTYLVSFTLVTAPASSGAQILIGGYASGSTISVGSYSRYVVATTTGGLILANGSDATTGHSSVWSGISVKQVTGIHASQPTTPAKPRLERGLRNLAL